MILMKQKNLFYLAAAFVVGSCMLFSGCSDDDEPTEPEKDGRVTTDEMFYANKFATDILNIYYYWNSEIAEDIKLLDPNTNKNPIKTVENIRYHEGNTKVDKWTSLIDDMQKFEEGIGGVNTTFGYMPITYKLSNSENRCVSAIAYVYKDSPAYKAGLRRGDVIDQINGKDLTTVNLNQLFNSSKLTLSIAKAEFTSSGIHIQHTDRKVTMTAVKMYEDPVLLDTIYEFNGKKVGYLAYTAFDLNSIPKLVETSIKFKSKGVKELILDLRYNGGGYVVTENLMASMYAPQEAVKYGALFEKEVYNNIMTEYLLKQGESTETRLTTSFKIPHSDVTISTKNANIGLEKIYGIITRNSASASEALLSGLMPYMDVELLGEQSHGKYCTGWTLAARNAYKKVPEAIKNWGMYVMVSIYQNSNGETPCMPNGLRPDIKVNDSPFSTLQLGDVNEVMLKAALQKAGKVYDDEVPGRSFTPSITLEQVESPRKANFGKRIITSNLITSLNQ